MIDSLKRLWLIRREISLKRIFNAIISRIINVYHYLAWKLPWGFAKTNRKRLLKFKDIHKGKRCFIIANGPSLKKIDFNLLKDEITIGMNRIYLMEKENGFMPTYLATIDIKNQLLQFLDEYDNLQIPVFFNWDLRHKFSKKENQVFLKGKFSPKFSNDLANEPYGNGKSVTYTCMQLAYYMGCEEVYLIGKDHSYNTSNKVGDLEISNGEENNHFIKGYYKKGMTWGPPDLKTEEFAYKIAREFFERNGKKIFDATVDGKLNVFKKVNFYSLFSNSD